jgi:hypothetical protein
MIMSKQVVSGIEALQQILDKKKAKSGPDAPSVKLLQQQIDTLKFRQESEERIVFHQRTEKRE